MFQNHQWTGAIMTGLGFLFMLVSMLLFFDRGLLVIANILILAGVTLILGVKHTLMFFNPFGKNRAYEKMLGIILFFLGFLMLLFKRGWVVVAFVLELIGLFQMFGSFLPQVLNGLRMLPVVGPILSAPGIKGALDWIAAAAPAQSRKKSAV
jgi:hypothetical protein